MEERAPVPRIADVLPAHDLIAGDRVIAGVEETVSVEDANTGRALGARRSTSPQALERAVAAADRAWGGGSGAWSGERLDVRAAALRRLADEIDRRAEAIAALDAQDTGVPLSITTAFARALGDTIRGVVDRAPEELGVRRLGANGRRVELHRLPWGPAALVLPWNAPAPLAVTKLANAMAAGCPAIIKPSEHASASMQVLVDAVLAADLPAGALQVVHGAADVGRALVSDPRIKVVSFTGGIAAGIAIAESSARHLPALQLELGGSNPAIVTDDAAVAAVAAQLARGVVKLNGQWCEAPRRVFVDAGVHDELVDALEESLSRLRIGSSLDADTDVGPQAHRGQRDELGRQLARLEAAGGRVRATAPTPDSDGFFVSPAVVTGLPPDAVRAEIFGPVVTVHAVGSDADALAAANALGDGLAGYVFATDADRAFALGRSLHAGEVRLGGTNLLDLAADSAQSFWGTSGVGGHGARDVLLAFCGNRIVGEENHALPL